MTRNGVGLAAYRLFRSLTSFRNLSTHVGQDSIKKTATAAEELVHFNALAASWWDVNGPQRILHKMNLLRMDFVLQNIRENLKLNDHLEEDEEEIYIPPFGVDILPKKIRNRILTEQDQKRDQILKETQWKALDVGCGGGILSESLARMPFIASIKGVDLSKDVLEAAKVHLLKDPQLVLEKKLTYELTAIEDLPVDEKFDIITMFEVLEHVNYPSQVLQEALNRINPGGWIFLSTINRDFVSWFTTIFTGEYLLKIVPKGTHTLEKYINQKEIREWIDNDAQRLANFEVVQAKGCIYVPAYGWKMTNDPDVGNYFMAIRRADLLREME